MGNPELGSDYDLVMVRCPLLSFRRLSGSELTGDQRVKPPGRRAGSACTKLVLRFYLNYLLLHTFIPRTHGLLGASVTPHC